MGRRKPYQCPKCGDRGDAMPVENKPDKSGSRLVFAGPRVTDFRCEKCDMDWDINEDFECVMCGEEVRGRFITCESQRCKDMWAKFEEGKDEKRG